MSIRRGQTYFPQLRPLGAALETIIARSPDSSSDSGKGARSPADVEARLSKREAKLARRARAAAAAARGRP